MRLTPLQHCALVRHRGPRIILLNAPVLARSLKEDFRRFKARKRATEDAVVEESRLILATRSFRNPPRRLAKQASFGVYLLEEGDCGELINQLRIGLTRSSRPALTIGDAS
ncbi:hypothetical protein MRX96_054214 [Rhipicephalus microplus]